MVRGLSGWSAGLAPNTLKQRHLPDVGPLAHHDRADAAPTKRPSPSPDNAVRNAEYSERPTLGDFAPATRISLRRGLPSTENG
ncbi:unnamed protein product [Cutaneotrichosporon oleaginosum]